MEKSFHFIGILLQNQYIFIKGPWLGALSARA